MSSSTLAVVMLTGIIVGFVAIRVVDRVALARDRRGSEAATVRAADIEREVAFRLEKRLAEKDAAAGEPALVTMLDGSTWLGVLGEDRPGFVVLEEAERIEADGSRVKVDGRAMLARAQLVTVQLP